MCKSLMQSLDLQHEDCIHRIVLCNLFYAFSIVFLGRLDYAHSEPKNRAQVSIVLVEPWHGWDSEEELSCSLPVTQNATRQAVVPVNRGGHKKIRSHIMKRIINVSMYRLVHALRELPLQGIVVRNEDLNGTRLHQVDASGVANGIFDLRITVGDHLGNATFELRECEPTFADVPDSRYQLAGDVPDLEVMEFAIGSEDGRMWAAVSAAYALAEDEFIDFVLNVLAHIGAMTRESHFLAFDTFTGEGFMELVTTAVFLAQQPDDESPGAPPHPICQSLEPLDRGHALPPAA